MSDKNDSKTIAKDALVVMFTENQMMARHHEEMRSNVATIFCTLATIDIGVLGVLMQTSEKFDFKLLPETIILTFLGIFGFLISRKLFERSVLHFKYAQAYFQTINCLVEENVSEFVQVGQSNRVTESKEIAKASPLDYLKEMIGKDGLQRNEKNELNKMKITLDNFKPVNPMGIVEAYQNYKSGLLGVEIAGRYIGIKFAKLDLFTLWDFIYGIFILVGIILSMLCALAPFPLKTVSAT